MLQCSKMCARALVTKEWQWADFEDCLCLLFKKHPDSGNSAAAFRMKFGNDRVLQLCRIPYLKTGFVQISHKAGAYRSASGLKCTECLPQLVGFVFERIRSGGGLFHQCSILLSSLIHRPDFLINTGNSFTLDQ